MGKASSYVTQGINPSTDSLTDLRAEIFTDNHEMAYKVIRRLGERGEPHNWKWSDFLIMCYKKQGSSVIRAALWLGVLLTKTLYCKLSSIIL